jgi:hypothetical protein
MRPDDCAGFLLQTDVVVRISKMPLIFDRIILSTLRPNASRQDESHRVTRFLLTLSDFAFHFGVPLRQFSNRVQMFGAH